jgi:hypothetical protein
VVNQAKVQPSVDDALSNSLTNVWEIICKI